MNGGSSIFILESMSWAEKWEIKKNVILASEKRRAVTQRNYRDQAVF